MERGPTVYVGHALPVADDEAELDALLLDADADAELTVAGRDALTLAALTDADDVCVGTVELAVLLLDAFLLDDRLLLDDNDVLDVVLDDLLVVVLDFLLVVDRLVDELVHVGTGPRDLGFAGNVLLATSSPELDERGMHEGRADDDDDRAVDLADRDDDADVAAQNGSEDDDAIADTFSGRPGAKSRMPSSGTAAAQATNATTADVRNCGMMAPDTRTDTHKVQRGSDAPIVA